MAKEMGLNMLNFHRAIGHAVVLDKADELGLPYYEEPGNYRSAGADPFAQALVREKLLRMVRRDRSHPSLVVYNMIDEMGQTTEAVVRKHEQDMRDAHALDPRRAITRTSAWATGKDVEDPLKLHMRPFDERVYLSGWYDYPHAGGPAVWSRNLYRNPREYYNLTDNAREIVFRGEEGAIPTPPRLEKIKEALAAAPNKGWDGQMYLDWYKAFDDFLTRKKLRPVFPTVDALTASMGAVSLYHQGRKIENIRISNTSDGYAINGWEAQIIENHSGRSTSSRTFLQKKARRRWRASCSATSSSSPRRLEVVPTDVSRATHPGPSTRTFGEQLRLSLPGLLIQHRVHGGFTEFTEKTNCFLRELCVSSVHSVLK